MKLFGVYFAGTVLATLVAAASVFLDLVPTELDSSILSKTVFSSNMRMVLAVGVEGTGHKYVLEIHDHMFDTNDQLVQFPSNDLINVGIYRVLHSMGHDVHFYSDIIDTARRQMRKMAKRAEHIPFPGTIAVIHGKYSHPMGSGPSKLMHYLDLQMLAKVAEEEGVDFRILYLRRSVKGIIIADTVHRQLQK